jgi:MFS family permease
MAAVRAWGVTFLTVAAAQAGVPSWLPAPALLLTIAGFIGIGVSITGNETAQRYGRMRVVTVAMLVAGALSLVTGWLVATSAVIASILVTVWLAAIFLDSSALTAGTVQASDPPLRGATMGLHSMCGYAGGFVGPLGVGLCLDLAQNNLALGWGLGFGHLAVVTLAGLVVLRRLRE